MDGLIVVAVEPQVSARDVINLDVLPNPNVRARALELSELTRVCVPQSIGGI